MTTKHDCKNLEENIIMLRKLESFREAFISNTKEEEKAHGQHKRRI
jgi:hypothetical protein